MKIAMGNNELAHVLHAVEQVLETQVRPLVKLHGGGVALVNLTGNGVVELEFEGACRGCSLKSMTYALGIRQKLLPVPGVTAVKMDGVRLSQAALDRVEKYYSGLTPWVGIASPTQ